MGKGRLIKKTDIRRYFSDVGDGVNPVVLTYIGSVDQVQVPHNIGEVVFESSSGKFYVATNTGWTEIGNG